MKWRWIITVGLFAVVIVCIFLLVRSDSAEEKAVAETKRALRKEGFKTDLSEFNFSTSAESRARAAALTNAYGGLGRGSGDYGRRFTVWQGGPDLMAAVGSNAALVAWKPDGWTAPDDFAAWDQARPNTPSSEDHWATVREMLNDHRGDLDAACQAALSGPIRFELAASNGMAMLLRHAAPLRGLAQMLASRAVLELHDGNKEQAWTNLLAASRVVTAWEIEPVEVSQSVRFACAGISFNAAWQVLQAGGWTDSQLARLQREWESVDFFKTLPETAAFSRASASAACQLERQQPLPGPGVTLNEIFRAPQGALAGLNYRWTQIRYRHHGSYEDEKALLLYYRDREVELRAAVPAKTWSEMRQLPGVTNAVPFQSKYSSRMSTMLGSRQIGLRLQRGAAGILGRAADAESRRRLIITAVALERYHGRHGSYPKTLADLVPYFLKDNTIDFMDGQPLRYRLTDDGHFVLYSVGLDCADNGGEMPRPRGLGIRQGFPGSPFLPGADLTPGTDLVWPRPASAVEAKAHQEEENRAREERRQAMLKEADDDEQEVAAARRRAVALLEQIYSQPQARNTTEPVYQGKPLSKILRNEMASGTNELTLNEMLTARQIATGKEPDLATFELLVSYDALTNFGSLQLLVDHHPQYDSVAEGGELQSCERATNGNCLLVWNTTYDPPGKHFVRAHLLFGGENIVPKVSKRGRRVSEPVEVTGPLVPFFSSNLCQFDPSYSEFDSSGATLYAKLLESNGLYTIELKSPAGNHIRTFTGSTSNGVINVHWDLTDDRGNRCTNQSVDSAYQITLPDSGRSQTLKGP